MNADAPTGAAGDGGLALEDVEMAAWRSFLAAHRRVIDELSAELREVEDLPLPWYDVLVQLSEAPERSLRMLELADAVMLSKSGLSRLVDRMEEAGLVRRESCPGDARGVMAALTDAGWQRLEEAAPTHVRGVRRCFVDLLAPDETAVLARSLGRVADQC